MAEKFWTPNDYSTPILDHQLVAFDLETSGAYPLGADIVEFAAVKWSGGQVIDTYQTLIKPPKPMGAFIIGIHGITNEMVESAPTISEKIHEIRAFISGSVVMAHHAPFDLGFMTHEFERAGMMIPNDPVVCTSLLSRAVIPESPNHKLQTLIQFLKLQQGKAHRALDDSQACLELALRCFERLGPAATLKQVQDKVGKSLDWVNFSLSIAATEKIKTITEALRRGLPLDIVYNGGTLKGKVRRVSPEGIVRNPDGDYMMAQCHIDRMSKRFYLPKIQDLSVVSSPATALSSS